MGDKIIRPAHLGKGEGMFRGDSGGTPTPGDKDKLPSVEFYDDLGLLSFFFAHSMQIPNLIKETYTLEVANGKVAVISDGKMEEKSHYYVRIRANVGAVEMGSNEIEPLPMITTVTKPIPIPMSVGKIVAFPVAQTMAALNQLVMLPDDKRPLFVRIKYEAVKDEAGNLGGRMEVRSCNENGGFLELLNPKNV